MATALQVAQFEGIYPIEERGISFRNIAVINSLESNKNMLITGMLSNDIDVNMYFLSVLKDNKRKHNNGQKRRI